MATEHTSSRSGDLVRSVVGVVLFLAWGVETVLWVYSLIHSLVEGSPVPLIMGLCALALMLLLAGMEGLEVAVIDRWRQLYPDREPSELAGWLAARQLFVALIVTTATILAEPESVPIPFTDWAITGDDVFWLKAFTITWTGFTVLWFMQIFPKHLAATNPDRYLARTKPALFPIVAAVHYLGIARPAEMVAGVVERRLDWHAPAADEHPDGELESLTRAGRMSPATAWAGLVPAPGRHRPPDDRTAQA